MGLHVYPRDGHEISFWSQAHFLRTFLLSHDSSRGKELVVFNETSPINRSTAQQHQRTAEVFSSWRSQLKKIVLNLSLAANLICQAYAIGVWCVLRSRGLRSAQQKLNSGTATPICCNGTCIGKPLCDHSVHELKATG